MANNRVWEWDKHGDLDAHASFHRELPAGATLSAPTAKLHQEVRTDVWVDRTSEVTIAATIVDARDPRTKELVTGGASRAVRVVITADPDPQPDATDQPEPATNYRVKLTAVRSDSNRPIPGDVDLVIVP